MSGWKSGAKARKTIRRNCERCMTHGPTHVFVQRGRDVYGGDVHGTDVHGRMVHARVRHVI